MERDYQTEILKLFAAQERLLGKLYRIFSENFLENGAFWNALMWEELGHAESVERLLGKIKHGEILFEESKARAYAMNIYMSYVKRVLEKARKREYSLKEALSLAFDIEKSLIEKNAFAHFKGDSPDAASLLDSLNRGSEAHLERVRQELLRHT